MVTHAVVGPSDPDLGELGPGAAVVTPAWVEWAVKFGAIPPAGAFHAAGIFKGAVVCTSGIGEDDVQKLWALVVSNGGVFARKLTSKCTHLLVVAGGGGGTKCAKAREEKTCRIVQPHWVTDSVAAGNRCAEEEYALPSEAGGGAAAEDAGTGAKQSKKRARESPAEGSAGGNAAAASAAAAAAAPAAKAARKMSSASPASSEVRQTAPPAPASTNPDAPFWASGPRAQGLMTGLIFCMSDSAKAIEKGAMVRMWTTTIRERGGQVDKAYSYDCTHFLTDIDTGADCKRAKRDGKVLATPFWLNDVLIQSALFVPTLAMHIPQSKDRLSNTAKKPLTFQVDGLSVLQHKYVSMTGFCGKERQDIKNLIAMAGGLSSPNFSRSNSYLICKSKEGKKYEKAVQWNIPRCSAKWLEETVKQWSIQPHLMRAYRIPDAIEPSPSLCPASSIAFTITNMDDHDKRDSVRAALTKLGAREVPALEATHLIADFIAQTAKFLTALSGCQHIVSSQWAFASSEAGMFVDENEHELIDEEGQRRYKIELEKVQERKRNILGCRGLLSGKRFCISPSVVPDRKTVGELILGAGGSIVPASECGPNGGAATLISCSADVVNSTYAKWPHAYRTDLIINGVMHQQMDYSSNKV